jgi:predicted ATPase
MIQQVSFTNFKSLRRVDAALGRFTVIVGSIRARKVSWSRRYEMFWR